MPERGIAFTLPGQQLGGKHPLLASAPMKNAGRMEFFRGTGMFYAPIKPSARGSERR